MEDGALVVKPLSLDGGEFSLEILKDLIEQGFSGEELVCEFEKQSKYIKNAIGMMLEEADEIAEGKHKGITMDEIFGENN